MAGIAVNVFRALAAAEVSAAAPGTWAAICVAALVSAAAAALLLGAVKRLSGEAVGLRRLGRTVATACALAAASACMG